MSYRICARCVMDTSDPEIRFDADGVCNHCHDYDQLVRERVRSGQAGLREVERIVESIRTAGKGRDYDCIIGVSGGVDSTYVAQLVKQRGLRALAVHLDNGWDSELAVKNIERVLRLLNIDLYTHVLDWPEFRDLQLAFLRASTPDSEVPSDHAIVSLLRHTARRLGIRHIVAGTNVRTETHLPPAWSRGHGDWRYIRSVHRRFGTRTLKSFPHTTYIQALKYQRTQFWVEILNFVDYSRSAAASELNAQLGWRDYGAKHHESIYTRFYQGYILPQKFGYDKRRAHLSSRLCSGEITRAEALLELETPPYDPGAIAADLEYVLKKLEINRAEFESIMAAPKRSYWDFPSYGRMIQTPSFRTLRVGIKWLRQLTA